VSVLRSRRVLHALTSDWCVLKTYAIEIECLTHRFGSMSAELRQDLGTDPLLAACESRLGALRKTFVVLATMLTHCDIALYVHLPELERPDQLTHDITGRLSQTCPLNSVQFCLSDYRRPSIMTITSDGAVIERQIFRLVVSDHVKLFVDC
jgi:hypothetical protein